MKQTDVSCETKMFEPQRLIVEDRRCVCVTAVCLVLILNQSVLKSAEGLLINLNSTVCVFKMCHTAGEHVSCTDSASLLPFILLICVSLYVNSHELIDNLLD